MTWLPVYVLPSRKPGHFQPERGEAVLITLVLAFASVFVVRVVLIYILPPEHTWFPAVFNEIRDARAAAKLEEIRRVARLVP